MFLRNMDVIHFLLPFTAFSSVLFGFEMGVMKVVMEILLLLKVWFGSLFNCNSKFPSMISTSNPMYYCYQTINETNHTHLIICSIRSCCILGAFCGGLLASFFAKKFERYRKKIFFY